MSLRSLGRRSSAHQTSTPAGIGPPLRERIEVWRPHLAKMLSRLNAEGLHTPYSTTLVSDGHKLYAENAPWTQAPVYFVSVEPRPGTESPFECVVKHDRKAVTQRQRLSAETRSLQTALPELFGVHGKWTVMERVNGVTELALETRLLVEPPLAKFWANQSAGVLLDAIDHRLQIDDVGYLSGHNCILEATSGRLRLVEQDSLKRANSTGAEVACAALLMELHYAHAMRREPGAAVFAFQLTRRVLERFRPEDLFARADIDSRYQAATTLWRQSTVLDPRLAQAAMRGNLEEFSNVLARGRVGIPLLDPSDPRAWSTLDGKGRLPPPKLASAQLRHDLFLGLP